MTKDSIQEQFDLWHDFVKKITYVNRFTVHHEIMDRVKSILEKNAMKIEKDTILYRARKYNGDLRFIKIQNEPTTENNDLEENSEEAIIKKVRELQRVFDLRDIEERKRTGFWGYDEKESFVPDDANLIKDGRANPAKIKYLYIADSAATALAEIRPLLKNYINIAEIIVLDELRIADLSYDLLGKTDESNEMLVYLIMNEYSEPNNDEPFKYLPTQFLSEYIKSLGFDGLKYNSSLYAKGRNFVIFNYEKCKAISSKLYQLDDICYEAKHVGADLHFSDDIYHWKLEAYRREQSERFIASLLPKSDK